MTETNQPNHAQQASDALDGKYGDVLRPFVALMEKELHANAGKGDRPGWLGMSAAVALLEIYYHVAKLQKAVKDGEGDKIKENAADVANMAMMLLDVCGGLDVVAARELTAAQGVDECSAISTGHKFGPFGPDRSVQCEYCGESPSQPIEPQGAVVGDWSGVRALPARWRMYAERMRTMGLRSEAEINEAKADELEAALPVAVGAGEDDGTSDYAVRQLGRWNREHAHRKTKESEAKFDAYHKDRAAMTPATPAGKGETK